MYNNLDLISETCDAIAMEKLQIQKPPHSGLTTVLLEKPSNWPLKLVHQWRLCYPSALFLFYLISLPSQTM